MQTKNIIQTSANVIRITNLKAGDMYKRVEDSSYSTSMKYGIVKAVLNNGEKTFIEAIEYTKSYSSIKAEMAIISGEKDIAIFPATIDEIKDEFNGLEETLLKEIETKEKEIEEKKKCIAETRMLLSGEMTNTLSSAEFKEMTQGQYNELKLIKAREMDL